jgi:DNA-directed RNA polymerase specialized sigma24 family protein
MSVKPDCYCRLTAMSSKTALNESLDRNLDDLRLYCFLMLGRRDAHAMEEILERAFRARYAHDDTSAPRARVFGIATEVCFERLGVGP